MANVTNISVLDSAATTATVSTLDAFRAGIGTSYMNTSTTIVAALPAGTNAIGSTTVIGSLPAGTNTLGTVLAANATASLLNATVTGTATISGAVTVANNTASALNATITGTAVLAAGASQVGSVTAVLAPSTAGGLLLSSTICTTNNNLTVVKASAGQVYDIIATNNTATIAYLKLYDNTTVAAGSGTPVLRIMIPGNSSGGAGIVKGGPLGMAFNTGICFATTGAISDTDTSSVLGAALLINITYK